MRWWVCDGVPVNHRPSRYFNCLQPLIRNNRALKTDMDSSLRARRVEQPVRLEPGSSLRGVSCSILTSLCAPAN